MIQTGPWENFMGIHPDIRISDLDPLLHRLCGFLKDEGQPALAVFRIFPREADLNGIGVKIEIADIKLEDLADPCRHKKVPFKIKMETNRSLTQQSAG